MTDLKDLIEREIDQYLEWPTADKSHVTTVSAKLFAEHVARLHADHITEAGKMVAPAEQGEAVAHTFYILHGATEGQEYIKKYVDDGGLAIFEREEDAQRAKRRHPGTEHTRVDYYAAPQAAPDVAELQAELGRELQRRFDGNEQASREHREDVDVLVKALENIGASWHGANTELEKYMRNVATNCHKKKEENSNG